MPPQAPGRPNPHSVGPLCASQKNLAVSGVRYLRLDGSVSSQNRQKMVHQFNTDATVEVFLISTRAGGEGINLTGANVVAIFDPNWNPSHDLQAQDRAFRIGQTRDVRWTTLPPHPAPLGPRCLLAG